MLLAAAMLAVPVSAQTGKTPEQSVKDFYGWYIEELSAERQPRRQRGKIRASASVRLSKWYLSEAYSNWGADYFVDAQDFNPNWAKGMSVSKATINRNIANLTVTLRAPRGSPLGLGPQTLRIRMVKEGGAWKIDRVNGRQF